MQSVLTRVRAGDVVMHETPRPRLVAKLAKAYRTGEVVPPIEIGHEKVDHWSSGPRGMEKAGHGYFLADGHHRLAAFIRVFGEETEFEVLMRVPDQKA